MLLLWQRLYRLRPALLVSIAALFRLALAAPLRLALAAGRRMRGQ